MKKTSPLIALGAALSLSVTLSACGTESKTPDTTSGESATSTTPVETEDGITSSSAIPWGRHVDTKTFKQALDQGAEVIDVRTPGEYDAGHLPGAKLIDVSGTNFATEIEKLDKSQPYAIYCRSGNRSRAAQKAMREAGFEKVVGLEGGIGAWDGPTQ